MKNEDNKRVTIRSKEDELSESGRLYEVLLLNDGFTPREFVMSALERFFYMDRCKAAIVMMEAHVKGVAACGVFSRDVAETVITQASTYAVKHEYPLSFRMEARNTI